MTTLAVDTPRDQILGNVNDFPATVDIMYEGSAIGLVAATGHARPLTSVDLFCGFCVEKTDNSAGSAADLDVKVNQRGSVKLSVTGAVITDVGNPVYATDDNAFSFSPVGGVFIGYARRFVSSAVMDVDFDAFGYEDPYAGRTWETYSASSTLDILDTAKGFWVDTDAQTMTLLTYAAATAIDVLIMNGGAYGTIAVTVDPDGGDKIAGPDDTGADGGAMVNTKATAKRGDFTHLHSGGDDGYIVKNIKGTWTIA